MLLKNKVRKVDRASVQPLSENALDLKKALQKDDMIIEHVFATNMRDVRKDENRYYFKYPGEWSTANMKHVIGVRGLYLIKANRFFKLNAELHGDDDGLIGKFEYIRFIKSCDDMFTYFDKLNDVFQGHALYQQYGVKISFTYADDQLRVKQDNDNDEYKGYYYKVELNDEIMKYMMLDQEYTNKLNKGDTKGFTMTFKDGSFYEFIILWNRTDELELRASFVKQTEYQHLGFTNNLYTPLKQYELECADNEFWIELYTNDQMYEVTLPDDKDMVVIETQLILKPL